MLNQKQILQYAIKGINKDIEELDKAARKGGQMIDAYNKGETLKTKLPIYEIENIYRVKKAEIEKLEQVKNELKWQLSELEEQEK
jgi:hypothetical protein|nr:MAG TPA: hypothetical protein [Caudoviricetes sp.]